MSDSNLERILIIDDNSDYRKLINTFISKLLPGAEVIEYDPVFEGVPEDDFNWSEIDVLLLDYHLSIVGTTGLDILHKHHKKNTFPATIMLTGAGTEEIAIRALKSGIYEYLPKQSLTKDKLKQSIIHAWEDKKTERQKKQELTQHNRSFSKEVFYENLERVFDSKGPERALVIIRPDKLNLLEEEIGIIGRDTLINHIAKHSYEVFKLGASNPNITKISETEIGIQIDYPINIETLDFNMQGLCTHLSKCAFKFAEEKYEYSVSIGVLKLGLFNKPAEQLIQIATTACDHASKSTNNSFYIWKETDIPPESDLQNHLDTKSADVLSVDNEQKLQNELETKTKTDAEAIIKAAEDEKKKLEAELKLKEEATTHAALQAEKEARQKAEAEEKMLAAEEEKLKLEAELKAKEEEAKKQVALHAEQEAKEKAEAEAKIKAAEEEKAKLQAELKQKEETAKAQAALHAEQEAKEKAEAEAKIKAAEEEKAKLLAELKQKEETERAKIEAELRAEQEAKNKADAEAKMQAVEEEKAKLQAALKAKEEEAIAEAKLKLEQEAKERAEAEAKIKAAEEEKEKLQAALKAKEEEAIAQAKLRLEQEAKEKAEAEARAKIEAEAKAKIEAEAKAKLEIELQAIAKAKEEAEAAMRAAKEEKEKLEAELKSIAKAKEKQEKEKSNINVSASDIEKNTNKEKDDISPETKSETIVTTAETHVEEEKDNDNTGENIETSIEDIEIQIKKLINENKIIQTYQSITAMFADEDDSREIYKTGLQALSEIDSINDYLVETSSFSVSLQQTINEWILRQVFLRITESGTNECDYLFLVRASESWFSDITLFQWLQKILQQTKKYNPGRSIILDVPLVLYIKHQKRAQALIDMLRKSHNFTICLSNLNSVEDLSDQCIQTGAKLLLVDIEQLKKLTETLAPNIEANNQTEEDEANEEQTEEKQNLLQYIKTKNIKIITSGIEDSTLLTDAITAGTDYTLGDFVGEVQEKLTESSMVESFELT